jgi:transcription elongation factor GreB
MSRAFVKDDAPEGQVVIPPRPALPPGVANYVTPRGLRLLREERVALESERGQVQAIHRDDSDRARKLAVVRGKITMLESRISSARLVDPAAQPRGEVRFGARVTLRGGDGDERIVTIVGVDEADASQGRLGFLAPMAKRLTGLKIGESLLWPGPSGPKPFRVVSVEY